MLREAEVILLSIWAKINHPLDEIQGMFTWNFSEFVDFLVSMISGEHLFYYFQEYIIHLITRNMKLLLGFLLSILLINSSLAQIDARLFQQPDISDQHITFVYAGDIWVVEKNGGTAFKLSSPD